MKKVAILKNQVFRVGGLEKYTQRLLLAFAKKNCEVFVLSTDNQIPEHFKNDFPVNFIKVTDPSKISLKQLINFDKACQKWLVKNPVDIVFGMERTTQHTHYRAGSGVHAAFLKQRKLTDSLLKRISFSLNPLHRTLLNYEKRCFEYKELKILFTNSEMVRKEILHHYHTPQEKIKVIHNGVEWSELEESFIQSFENHSLKNNLGLKKNAFQFLFIGNGYKRKGLDFLLKALSHLSSKDFELIVVGKDKDPEKYKQLAYQCGIGEKVKFFGPQKRTDIFYQAADALVISSIYDPFANVTLEALAMGLFVVSSRFNGGSEILLPETGILIDDLKDSFSMSKILARVLERPKNVDLAKKIRDSVKKYDFSHQLDKIVELSLI